MKKTLEKKLKIINNILEINYLKHEDLGPITGLSGISLFSLYYSNYLNDEKNSNLGLKTLSACISKIDNGYSEMSFCKGIAGLGWIIDHLNQENLIKINNDELLSNFDNNIYSNMVSNLKNYNYDFLYGGIGSAYYFLNRYKNTKSKKLKSKYEGILVNFIDLLENISEVDGLKIRWESKLNIHSTSKTYDLGLSHGIPSIIGFLTKLHKYKAFKIKTNALLKGAINYVLSLEKKDKKSFSLFPNKITNDIHSNTTESRLGWCYGDLGIGITLLNASIEIKDDNLKTTSLRILKHSTNRKTNSDTMLENKGLCHGSFGIAQIFHRAYTITNDKDFKIATEYWILEGLDDFIPSNKDLTSINDISFINGITGIGLTILNYLSESDLNWDECLMIN